VNYADDAVTLYGGDVLAGLVRIESETVQTCVTSPPYWGLRDYGVDGQIGLEPTPDAYVSKLVAVFREVRRVLKDDGTLWLNLGDSYSMNTKGAGGAGKQHTNGGSVMVDRSWSIPAGLKPKDLCGIPWRVAFALQQPYEHTVIKSREDRAWLAALVDGEGCLSILECGSSVDEGRAVNSSYPPILQVRMCDRECIDYAIEITGCGATSKQYPPSQGGIRPSFQWRLHGRKAANVVADIYPYLRIKRKQAAIVFTIQKIREGYTTKRGQPVPAEAIALQEKCRQLIQRLNAHEQVDLPDWIEEPTVRIEPGWYLRSDVIWAKPNPMPESVTDRPTKAHEYLFLLSKRERYYYDAEAIKEPQSWLTIERFKNGGTRKAGAKFNLRDPKENLATYRTDQAILENGRNRRTVWEVATQPYPEAHFATFPPKLIEPCILAGSRPGDTVLDPFAGSGTTLAVSKRLGRKAIGIELNPDYLDLAMIRVGTTARSLF